MMIDPDHIITMRRFGQMGRFGNQLFQYAFLKTCAEELGCELQLPPWVGQYLFGANDPPIALELPTFREHAPLDWLLQPQRPEAECLRGRDFDGYAQYHTSTYLRHGHDRFRALFQPIGEIRKKAEEAASRLRNLAECVIGIHLRRGDYGQLYFYFTPVGWYLDLLRHLVVAPKKSVVVFVASEDPLLAREFSQAGYRTVTAADLGIQYAGNLPHYNYLRADLSLRQPWQMDFYWDFYLLTKCDHLLIPNSAFSFAAAMLNRDLRSCWRSNLITRLFHEIDPWDAWPVERDTVDHYPCPGTYLDSNPPYWETRTKLKLTRG